VDDNIITIDCLAKYWRDDRKSIILRMVSVAYADATSKGWLCGERGIYEGAAQAITDCASSLTEVFNKKPNSKRIGFKFTLAPDLMSVKVELISSV